MMYMFYKVTVSVTTSVMMSGIMTVTVSVIAAVTRTTLSVCRQIRQEQHLVFVCFDALKVVVDAQQIQCSLWHEGMDVLAIRMRCLKAGMCF